MSDSVAAAVIGAVVLLACAVLGLIGVLLPLLISTRRHARTASEQVTNDHDTNLRVELDTRNGEYLSGISEVKQLVKSSDKRNGRRFASVGRDIKSLRSRLEVVEGTIPRASLRGRS